MEMSNGHPIIDIFLPTFRMEPEEHERFFPSKGKAIADKIISDELNGAVYDEEDAKNWSINISDRVREAVTESMGPNSRYKVVVQTTIGQMRDQGIRIASRCLWDPTTDNYASCSFSNETLFCSCLVFALYTD
uniref:Dynein light chain n=1 Tax=Spumella elongata TaxID=89044 RepID=A0A7S3HL07_9STRA|mmetsp:Transcript_57376/g.100823  ORF Transcript_57376/g.100823 Transcript_57376/m.100823 type:complete len:133 (+) Transcript_57376:80-478(+)|eukprot:CAMPEP_0184970816 /NCGR_PEP_ID=MMETSP1098-20130426/3165_1 /TAXON_ID=89044 /ORGANISM="Spumella elongata, Strain CCAP 955/1" /LENGTH=132 /DNA_ID=CAMNT_0027492801 /DNA_START=66 /DNA_END=464 /DNA_ORIENTATION=-